MYVSLYQLVMSHAFASEVFLNYECVSVSRLWRFILYLRRFWGLLGLFVLVDYYDIRFLACICCSLERLVHEVRLRRRCLTLRIACSKLFIRFVLCIYLFLVERSCGVLLYILEWCRNIAKIFILQLFCLLLLVELYLLHLFLQDRDLLFRSL